MWRQRKYGFFAADGLKILSYSSIKDGLVRDLTTTKKLPGYSKFQFIPDPQEIETSSKFKFNVKNITKLYIFISTSSYNDITTLDTSKEHPAPDIIVSNNFYFKNSSAIVSTFLSNDIIDDKNSLRVLKKNTVINENYPIYDGEKLTIFVSEFLSERILKLYDNPNSLYFYFMSSTLRRSQQTLYYIQKILSEKLNIYKYDPFIKNINNNYNYIVFPNISEINYDDINIQDTLRLRDSSYKYYDCDNPYKDNGNARLFQEIYQPIFKKVTVDMFNYYNPRNFTQNIINFENAGKPYFEFLINKLTYLQSDNTYHDYTPISFVENFNNMLIFFNK